MFDAGAIMAHLDVDTQLFDRKLKAAEDRVKRFEDTPHHVRLDATFDAASFGRARQMFAQLDNQLSRDAMSRLRGSPQGSVLGSLNALFSPHPVSGGPTAMQAATRGLLGQMVSQPGGAAGAGGGGNLLANILAGQQRTGSGQSNQDAGGGFWSRILGGAGGGLLGRLLSRGGGGDMRAAEASVAAAEDLRGAARDTKDAAAASKEASRGFRDFFKAPSLRGFFKGETGGGGGGPASWLGGIAGGAGPNMPGVPINFMSRAGALAGIGLPIGLGAMPALLGVGGIAGVGAIGGGALMALGQGAMSNIAPATQAAQQLQQAQATGNQQQIKTAQAALSAAQSQMTAPQKQLFAATQGIQNWWQTLTTNLTAPIAKALGTINTMLSGQLGRTVTNFFRSATVLAMPLVKGLTDIAMMVLPQLSKSFQIVAPAIRPLLDGLGMLVRNIFPGLNALMKATAPYMGIFAKTLGTLGADLGQMFKVMAPAVGPSMVILTALLKVVGGLLPIIGFLAAIFAKSLAPVIVQLATAFEALEPSLVIIGKLFAAMVGAVMSDLVALFVALTKIIVAIAPSLAKFADAFAQVFVALENYGVFASLANVIESLAPLLAKLIILLLQQLTPVLPVLITLISQFATIMTDLLAAGLTVIIGAVISLITHFKWIIPLIAVLTTVWLAWNLVMSANPLGLIIIAIVAVIGAIYELYKHWGTVWKFIKDIAKDAWNFLTHGWGQFILPGLTLIRLAVEFVRDHWKQAWDFIRVATETAWHVIHNDILAPVYNWFTQTIPHAFDVTWGHIKGWWDDVTGIFRRGWDWLENHFGTPVHDFLTQTVPGWFKTAKDNIGNLWNDVQNVVEKPVKFVINTVLDGLISIFNDITGAIGLKSVHINPIYPLGHALGGLIGVGTTGTADDVLIRVSKGETVVSAQHSAQLAPLFAMMGIPGYQHGGPVGPVGQHAPGNTNPFSGIVHFFGKVVDLGKMALAFATGNATAFNNAFGQLLGLGTGGATGIISDILTSMPREIVHDLVSWIMGQGAGGASGSAIVDFAMSFLGKVPYVWGATDVPLGADCSGFVQFIYRHFGINAPRTSEAQGAWVTRGPPTPGGLAFYHSPPGGPDPGHVAIVRNALQVISQGGGLGPQLMPLHAMPLLWTGTPPGGLGGTTPGSMTASAIAALWTQMGGPAYAAANMARIAYAESGDQPGAIQKGQPPGLTGWGLYQITPTSGITQGGRFGNLLNAANNTRAAIFLFNAAGGYGPWASDPVGASLVSAGPPMGFAAGGLIREPVIGFGTTTGQQYTFAENGPEWVTPAGMSKSMIGNVYIQLPEGHTVARALTDLSFWLAVARQQNYAGVLPGG